MGIDPEEYYDLKRREIYLYKQDYLDNLIWLLYRSLELGVEIENEQRVKMENEASQLLKDIYYKAIKANYGKYILDMYYESWKLRGDHPDLYLSGNYQKIGDSYDLYKNCMEGSKEFTKVREDKIISDLYYCYHFVKEVKEEGLKVKKMSVDSKYIKLMRDVQQAIRLKVAQKGIAVECNPTSNVLIGTFKSYSKHPLLIFNNHMLKGEDVNPCILASINTDDLGVFDTSLENEYALIFEAIAYGRREVGNYAVEDIYEYLDYLRKNGLRMAFKPI